MEYTNIINQLDNNSIVKRPRYLTNEEIELILNQLPEVYGVDPLENDNIKQSIKDYLGDILKNKKLTPAGINNVANEIVKQFNESRIAAGSTVGTAAAEAASCGPTQAALNSVAPWEELIIQDQEGNGKIVQIGPWIDELLLNNQDKIELFPKNKTQYLGLEKPVYISSCDEDGKVNWDLITGITKHLPKGDLIKVVTRSGREVTATLSKSLLVWDGSKIVPIKGKNLKVGDLVPVSCQIPTPKKVYNEIDLQTYLPAKEWIYTTEMNNLKRIYDNTPDKNGFWSRNNRLINVPYSRGDAYREGFADMERKLDIIFDGYIFPKSWGKASHTRVPDKIVLNKQFGQIVGLYLADGCATDTYISISKNSDVIRKVVSDWCDTMNIKYHEPKEVSDMGVKIDIRIHSVLFARFFKKWIGTGSADKIMPSEILFGNEEFIKGVLDGYISGDGTVNKRDGSIVTTSASKALIYGTSYLCSRLGMFGKISGHQLTHNNLGTQNILYTHTFTLRNMNAGRWYDIIGSCNDKKAALMKQREWKQGWGQHYTKHNDVMLDPVISIEKVQDIEYVYDLTIPATLHFQLYNGLNMMDSFHSAGQSRAGAGGINEVEELFYAKKNRKVELCTIHYKDKTLSYEDVLETKKDVEGSMFSQFIKDYLYIKEGDKYVKDCVIDTYDNLSKKWWHNNEYYLKLIKAKIPGPQDYVLRINLNLKEMYKYKVSIQDLVNAFKREHDSPISVLYGSMEDGIIDVYACADFVPNKKGIATLEAVNCKSNKNDMASASFYQTIIIPGLDNLRIKGVSGISGLTPIKVPIISVILNDEQVAWMLHMKSTENVVKLFNLLGINVMKTTPEYVLVGMPKFEDFSYFITQNSDMKQDEFLQLNPIEYVDLMMKIDKKNNPKNKQKNLNLVFSSLKNVKATKVNIITLSHKKMKNTGIDLPLIQNLFHLCNLSIVEQVNKYNLELLVKLEDYDALNDVVKQKVSKKEYQLLSPRALINMTKTSEVERALDVIHAEVLGSNLKGLLSLPFLDKTRIKSNNVHVVASVYGNRAARKVFLEELYDLLSPFGIHPQHMLTVADIFFSRGVPTGAMFNSTNKQLGPVDKATVSKAVEIFKTSSLHGVDHSISGVSTHIAFGVAPKIGTGYFDIVYHGKNKISSNIELYTAFKNEQAYLDRQANEVTSVKTDDPNGDLQRKYEKDDVTKMSSDPIPRGKKVKLDFQEPVVKETEQFAGKYEKPVSKYVRKEEKKEEPKVPVSKYSKKVVKEEEEVLKEDEPKVPVSRYTKKVVKEEEEEPKVPVSRYSKKVVKEEVEEPKVPVSKYSKKKVIKEKEEKEESESDESEEEKPKVSVSRYSKAKTLKNEDISTKSRRTKK